MACSCLLCPIGMGVDNITIQDFNCQLSGTVYEMNVSIRKEVSGTMDTNNIDNLAFCVFINGSCEFIKYSNELGGVPAKGETKTYSFDVPTTILPVGTIAQLSVSYHNIYGWWYCTGSIDLNSCTSLTLTTISVTPASASINVNTTTQLTATCKDQNNAVMTCPTLTWASSNTSIVTVSSSGLVTGVAAGSANITASGGGKTSNACTVTVASAGTYYKCENGTCNTKTGTGTSDCSNPGGSCGGTGNNYCCYNGVCTSGCGTMPAGCSNSCSGTGNGNGSCKGKIICSIPDTYVYIGGGVLALMFMMMAMKR